MLNSIRASIYLMALLLCMVFLLWFINIYLNQKVINRELDYTRLLQQKSKFSLLVIKEPQDIPHKKTFKQLVEKEKNSTENVWPAMEKRRISSTKGSLFSHNFMKNAFGSFFTNKTPDLSLTACSTNPTDLLPS